MSKPFKIFELQPLNQNIDQFFQKGYQYGVSVIASSLHQHLYADGFNGSFSGCSSLRNLDHSFLVEGICHESNGSLSLYDDQVYLGSCIRVLSERHEHPLFNYEEHVPLIIFKVLSYSCVDKLVIDSKEMLISFLEYQLTVSSLEEHHLIPLIKQLKGN